MEETAHATGTTASNDYEATTRESLLDVILDRMAKAGKSTIISRVVLVAQMNSRMQNVDHHKAFFTKLVDKIHLEGDITGLVLAYPTCLAAIFEAKTGILLQVLRDLQSTPAADSKISAARIICCTEDIPARVFHSMHMGWVASLSNADSSEGLDSASAVKAGADLNAFLRKVGSSFVGLSESELRKRLFSLESYHDEVPPPEQLLALTATEDAPTIEEFLELFDAPINVDLDSEKVWPMPTSLKY